MTEDTDAPNPEVIEGYCGCRWPTHTCSAPARAVPATKKA